MNKDGLDGSPAPAPRLVSVKLEPTAQAVKDEVDAKVQLVDAIVCNNSAPVPLLEAIT